MTLMFLLEFKHAPRVCFFVLSASSLWVEHIVMFTL